MIVLRQQGHCPYIFRYWARANLSATTVFFVVTSQILLCIDMTSGTIFLVLGVLGVRHRAGTGGIDASIEGCEAGWFDTTAFRLTCLSVLGG